MRRDPRYYQITVLALLLLYGLIGLDFDITTARAALTLLGVLAAQYVATALWRLPTFDPRSALISGLSLCLLLRTNSLVVALAIAFVTIAGGNRNVVSGPARFEACCPWSLHVTDS